MGIKVDDDALTRATVKHFPLGGRSMDFRKEMPAETKDVPLDGSYPRITGATISGAQWNAERMEVRYILKEFGLSASYEGDIIFSPLTIAVMLEYHPYWRGAIRYNELTGAFECSGKRITDVFAGQVEYWFEMQWLERKLKHTEIDRQVELVARKQSYHPVREELLSHTWDGHSRIGAMLDALHAEKSHREIYKSYLRAWLVGAVKRLFEPGCKFDAMLVLQGAQGIRKSTFFRELAGGAPAYNELSGDQWQKPEIIHAAWVHEFAELESVTTRADVGRLKGQLSTLHDTYRPAYGRKVMYMPRPCVFVGTTNEAAYLRDRTGNRRFWIVECKGDISAEWLRANRGQIWAEAIHLWRAGEPCWLTAEEQSVQAEMTREQEVEDPWHREIEDFTREQLDVAFHTNEVLRRLDVDVDKRTQADSNRVGAILRSMGFQQKAIRPRDGSKVFRGWTRGPSSDAEY